MLAVYVARNMTEKQPHKLISTCSYPGTNEKVRQMMGKVLFDVRLAIQVERVRCESKRVKR
jgi:hypothetical protein